MSNLQSLLGGTVWAAIAAVLMLAALEPTPAPSSEAHFAAVKIAAGYAEA
jgi:translation initiation factor 2 gamma subunit (eIF-2gamma)